MNANSKLVLEYVKANDGKNFTAQDIADATGLSVKQVNGIVTSAFQKVYKSGKGGYMERVPAEVELSDGTHKTVKLIRFTEKGKTYDWENDPDSKQDKED